MGRHSAGDDDEGTDVRLVAPVTAAPGRRGRHSREEDGEPAPDTEAPAGLAPDEQPTERIGLVDLLAAAEEDAEPHPHPLGPELEYRTIADEPAAAPAGAPVKPQKAPKPPKASKPQKPPKPPRPARGDQSTAADLELLRKHPDVRARVIAAVVVPFVLYAAVLLLIGARAVQFLIFIWIPLVSAGVLAGLFLDAAHKRARAKTSDGSPGDPPG